MNQAERKILYVQHSSEIGGASWCLYELLRHQSREDFVSSVLLSQPGPLVDRIKSLEGVDVEVDSKLSPISPLCGAKGVEKEIIGFIRSLLRQPRGLWSFYRHCRCIKPDIVHLNSSALFALALPAKLAGVPRVLLHNREHWWSEGLLRPKGWLKDAIVFSCVDHILAITDTTIDLFGFRSKSSVVHDWSSFDDEEIFDVRKEHEIDENDFLVLVLGGFKTIKGTATAMESLAFISDLARVKVIVLGCVVPSLGKLSKIYSWMKGTKPYHELVQGIAAEYPGSVIFLPPTLQVKAFMQACDVVVCPFQIAHAAKAALEAGELGKPVIISDNGEGREYVRHLKSGVVVSPHRAEDFAAAINFLKDNPDVAGNFGKNGRAFIAREFDMMDSIRKMQELYGCV